MEMGLRTAPVTRARERYSWLRKEVRITATCGSRINEESLALISVDTSAVVLPPASTSPINGTVILPSGRTGTLTLRSGLCHTVTCNWSSTPIRYVLTACVAESTLGGGSVDPPVAHAVSAPASPTVARKRSIFMSITASGRNCSHGNQMPRTKRFTTRLERLVHGV